MAVVAPDTIEGLTLTLGSLAGRIDALIEAQSEKNKIIVTHTQGGMGSWGVAAVVACFFTTVMLLGFAYFVVPELHDLRAWSDQYRGQIANIQQTLRGVKP